MNITLYSDRLPVFVKLVLYVLGKFNVDIFSLGLEKRNSNTKSKSLEWTQHIQQRQYFLDILH